MEIRFISSITAEDEARIAPALIEFVGSILDSLPVAYTLRIETAAGLTFHRSHPTSRPAVSPPGDTPPIR
jgi:hypothetical protein